MSEAPEGRSLADLFAADPLSLTKEDRKPIIEYYRSKRGLFMSTGKTTVAKAPKQQSKGPLPDLDLDIGDLSL